eukprot:TRINITY_DN8886_c0_g1_i1.p1 TRINITY_DN8886_c0_g1~~TRINITY_DN8886_c0_g1_i1.p1  ORF type:complete len:472 (+),score=81.95 TRINITY_DN8886_c0_g1_i1:37-1452(+)
MFVFFLMIRRPPRSTLSSSSAASDVYKRQSPHNPRYLEFRNETRLLVTSTEHFGGLINLDFDYEAYLDTLAANNFSLTQTWAGAYVEPDADVGPYNTLDPRPQSYMAPWARSSVPGNAKGGNKFDLTQFNQSFFNRMVGFVRAASDRGIVVELSMFGGYEQTHPFIWDVCPFNPHNNINSLTTVNISNVYSLSAPPAMLQIQLNTVRKIASELSSFDNLYFQIVSVGNVSTPQWGKQVANAIIESVPTALIAQPSNWPPLVESHVTNYGAFAKPQDIVEAGLGRGVLSYDETGGRGSLDAYRRSYWEWAMSGGGVIDNMDWSFMTGGFENGTLPASRCHEVNNSGVPAREALGILNRFVSELDLTVMVPDSSKHIVPEQANCSVYGLVYNGASTKLSYSGSSESLKYAGFVWGGGQLGVNMETVCSRRDCGVVFSDTVGGVRLFESTLPSCVGTIQVPMSAHGDVALTLRC